ncbi:MAG: hypothetical protein IKU25_01065 [Clostridia bacterium]|nr:hypothetical protein [Clostridia bacterium]
MKPFLGIDITTNKKNTVYNGEEFLVNSASSESTHILEDSIEQAGDVENKAKLPIVLRVIMYVCLFGWLIIAGGILKGMRNVDLKTAYANAPELFYVCGACFVIWGILFLATRSKAKNVGESEETQVVIKNLDDISKEIYAELNVPEDAVDVDVLSFCYKIKKGQPVAKTRGVSFFSHANFEYKAFVQDDKLYLANLEGRYEFPFSELKGILTVNKRISIPEWNKDVPPNVGPYKQYKMTVDNYRCIHLKTYHILKVMRDGEIWGIYFPCYELGTFEALTGFTTEQ